MADVKCGRIPCYWCLDKIDFSCAAGAINISTGGECVNYINERDAENMIKNYLAKKKENK